MQNLDKRISKLEAKGSDSFKLLWLNQNETVQQARERAGISPTDNVFILTWKGLDMEIINRRVNDAPN